MTILFLKRLNDSFEENIEKLIKKGKSKKYRNFALRIAIKYANHFHGFRKFFRTNSGNAVGRDYAEALMGHSFYLDTYYQLTDEKKREMDLEVEPYLTVSDFKTVENNFKNLSAKYIQLKGEFDDFRQYAQTNSISVPESL